MRKDTKRKLRSLEDSRGPLRKVEGKRGEKPAEERDQKESPSPQGGSCGGCLREDGDLPWAWVGPRVPCEHTAPSDRWDSVASSRSPGSED